MEAVTDFIFLGSKFTAEGACSHIIKRCLLLGRRAMTNLDNILKSRGTRDQKLPTSSKKQENSRKTSTSASLTMIKPLCGSQQTGKFLEMGIPDHLICVLRNLYAGQEATVRTGHGTSNWFKIGKGVCQGYILSPCLFNLHAEYLIQNAGLDESQAGIKIVERNINNLR